MGVFTRCNSANRLKDTTWYVPLYSYDGSIGSNAYTLQFPSTIKSDGPHERSVRTIDGSVLDCHVIRTPGTTPQAPYYMWLVYILSHCGAVPLRSFPASPTASSIVITPIIPSLALSCLLLLPFVSRL